VGEHDLSSGDDLSPDPVVLAHLHALVERLALTTASRLAPRTESERHRLAYGHALGHGCCRPADELELSKASESR